MVLEGDSQVLMTALINDSMFLSSDSFLIDDVRFDPIFYTQLCYSYIKREGNKVTHSLSRYDLCILDFVVWMEDVPPHFLSVVQIDIVGFFNERFMFFLPKKKKRKKFLIDAIKL